MSNSLLALTLIQVSIAAGGLIRVVWFARAALRPLIQVEQRRGTPLALLSWQDFEALCTSIVQAHVKNATVQHVGRPGDGGIDIEVRDLAGRLVLVVQCKHRKNPLADIPPMDIQALDSVKRMANADAWLMTNAHFSRSSQALAAKLGVTLIDGEMIEKGRKHDRVF